MLGAAVVALTVLCAPQKGFSHGLSPDPSYFPIAVWLQDPSNAGRYKAAGINLYVGLWQGPTAEQLTRLTAEKMPVICAQNAFGVAHRDNPIIKGWMLNDEPDNAQERKDPVTGKADYGPCIPPADIVAEYRRMHAADPTRPILLNLGQGIANDEWIGRGAGASLKDYETYVQGGDVISFDVYPVAGLTKPQPADFLWYVAKGLDRMRGWMHGQGTRWNCIECTRIGGEHKATPAQVRSEVWMSLIHGSRGLIYFVHEFSPKFDEHALLDDPEMLAAVSKLNHEIAAMAMVINAPDIDGSVSVQSSGAPIDTMVKRLGGRTTVFAVGMRNAAATGSFECKGLPDSAPVRVVGEDRMLVASHGRFVDSFAPYGVHIYQFDR